MSDYPAIELNVLSKFNSLDTLILTHILLNIRVGIAYAGAVMLDM